MLKKVIQEYSGTIVEAVVVVALLLLVFFGIPAGNGKYGIGSVLSNGVKSDGIDYNAYADAGAVEKAIGRAKPDIVYVSRDVDGKKQRIIAEKDVNLTLFFSAKDADNQNIDTKIISIQDKNGVELITQPLTTTDTFRFPASGTYNIEVVATDSFNRHSEIVFSVPVAKKTQEVK